MRTLVLIIALGLYWQNPLGAQNSGAFPKQLQQDIFNIYQLKLQEFYGILDSTESLFCVHLDSAKQSQFDSSCLLSKGLAWHRGQRTDFTTYITIDTIQQVTKSTDTALAEYDYWALQLPELKVAGNTLWKCEGEFSMNEDPTQNYSGKFTGTFCIYFIYQAKSKKLIPLAVEKAYGLEPVFAFYGFWKSYKKGARGIAFFFASTAPQQRDDGSSKIADLRFQPDGNQSFSNIVILSADAMRPPANWFQ